MNAPEALAFGLMDEILGDTDDVIMLQRPEVRVALQGGNGTAEQLLG